MINIENKSKNIYIATVVADETTSHEVTVDDKYYEKLTCGEISKEELLRRSMVFLMGRESNTEILSKFKLQQIQDYFPEYEKTIKKMLTC